MNIDIDEEKWKDGRDFSPHLIHLNYGTLSGNHAASVRMTLWYEIELITNAQPGSGVDTCGTFLPAERGLLYIRRPGMIVQGFPIYAYKAVLFDAVYDPELESMYQNAEGCLHASWDEAFLSHLRERNHFFRCLEKLPVCLVVRNMEQFSYYYDEIFHAYLDRDSDVLRIKSLIYQLVVAVGDEMTDALPRDNGSTTTMLHLQRYIDDSYAEHIDLTALARSAALSREYLCRLFRQVVGMSPMTYLLNVRVFHAKQQLIITNDPIRLISEQCGFSSEQYFFQAFKRLEGKTPHQYRAEKLGVNMKSAIAASRTNNARLP